MKTSEQTIQQIQRAIRKICQKFPADSQNTPITDIHIRVYQETGELLAFDDDDNEITRCVIEQWIENKDDNFYQDVAEILRKQLQEQQETIDQLNISKPFSLVLEDDEKENLAELYIADDDTVIIGKDLMDGLEKDLDSFLEQILKE